MARISRKELKKDQFVTEVSRTYQFLQQHRTALILLLIAVVLVMVLGLGGYFYVQNRKARANEELAHAIRVFYAPTSSENPQTEPDMKFSDEEARYRQAEKEFAAIAQKYGWLAKLRFGDQPRMARYYLGLTKQHLGQTEEAMRELRTLAEQEQDQQLAPLARFALAGIYVQNGKPDEAEKLYRELADRPGELISREMALLTLAEHLSEQKPEEAEKIYQQIQKETPDGAAADAANKRLSSLRKSQ